MRRFASQGEATVPGCRTIVCVDLEGALLRNRIEDERLVALIRQRPGLLLRLPWWWLQGRADTEVGAAARIGLDTLPLDEGMVEQLRDRHAEGCELVLLSSLDRTSVAAVANRVGIFGRVVGNLSPDHKREMAEQTFGPDVVYVDRNDAKSFKPSEVVANALKALRLHQWAKNALVFVPVTLSGPLASSTEWVHAAMAFMVFGLLASAGYLANDLLDLGADRSHQTKRLRPFAAGHLTIRAGVLGIPVLALAAASICLLLPGIFAVIAAIYFATTLAYSLVLKQEPFLDVIVLASLFTIRIMAGALLLSKPFSYWLLTFAMFFFLGLATAKRVVELKSAGGVAQLRGYHESDLQLLIPLGISAIVGANLVFVTYLISEHLPGTTYANPEWLWLVLPLLLYWPLRLWRVVMRGHMDDDPVLFAIRDRVSLGLGGLVLLLVVLAW